MNTKEYDFGGWATKNNIRCADGRTIRQNAFIENDGGTVPLVWNHQHDMVDNILGHAHLENREEGVYAYGTFNNTPTAQHAKEMVRHGDLDSLSIYANRLKHNGGDVTHGRIREVSLVLAGANPGATIDTILAHSDDDEEDAIIAMGEDLEIYHSDDKKNQNDSEESEKNSDEKKEEKDEDMADEKKPKSSDDKTIQEVLDTLNEEQTLAVEALVGMVAENLTGEEAEVEHSGMNDYEGDVMKHNIFEGGEEQDEILSHSEMMAVIEDGKRFGSLRESAIHHGITNIEYLFPDAKSLNNPPDWIRRPDGWVKDVMNGVHHTPFSRIKSMFADLTEDEARARGYIKGKLKKEQVFSLLKRTTTPQTVYKKQKLDRDDVIDITDFDVIAWIKTEMRFMLEEEIARAVLIGDGRLSSSDDKIQEDKIRPIWTDAELYTINKLTDIVSTDDVNKRAKKFIRAAIKARKDYRGSGSLTMFINEDKLTDLLLLEDNNGRVIYETEDKLRNALRVSKIVSVPVMDNLTREVDGKTRELEAIFVNLTDYNIGADKGGAVQMFDDFDIDYNAQKYLIETRCSGALTRPFSAIVVETEVAKDKEDKEDDEDEESNSNGNQQPLG